MKNTLILVMLVAILGFGCASPVCSQNHNQKPQQESSEDCCEHKTKKHPNGECCKHPKAQAAEEEKNCEEKSSPSKGDKKDEKPNKKPGGIIFRGYNGFIKSFNGDYKSPHGPISQSEQRAEPVRKSSGFLVLGRLYSSHDQGTDDLVQKSFNPYTGSQETKHLRTWNRSVLNIDPQPYFTPQMVNDSDGPHGGTVSGFIPLIPTFVGR